MFVALALSGCERVDLETLPEVPRVRFDTFLPGVQKQLEDAYAAVDKNPADPEINGRLAMLLQTYKQFAAADTMYARTRLLAPDEFDWAYLHALVLVAVGKPDESIDALRYALTLTEGYPLAKIHLANQLAQSGAVAEAAALFDEVLRTGPPLSEAYFSHGKFLLRRGQAAQAIAALKETLRISGPLGTAYYQLGLAYRQLGEIELAQENFALAKRHEGYAADSSDRVLNRLLPLNLSDTPFVHRAKVLAENGRLDEAERFIQMALERNPDSLAAHTSMIGMATRRGDFALADEHFAQAQAINPNNPKIYFNLGMARLAEKRFVEATQAFEKSIGLDQSDPNAHVQLAILHHRDGQTAKAKQHLVNALDADPAHPRANWLMGELRYAEDDLDGAIGYLEKASEQATALRPLMLVQLARARLDRGDYEQAETSIAKARADLAASPDPSVVKRLDEIEQEIRTAIATNNDAI